MAIATLEEVKTQCRLTSSFILDDTRLTSLMTVASELAQNYTNRLLSEGSVVGTWYKYESSVSVVGGNVEEIDSVTCKDPSGNDVVITDFNFNPVSQTLRIPEWYSACTDFFATYTAGYKTPPAKIKQGVLMLVATLYNNTEDYLVGLTHDSLPYTSTVLFDSERDYYYAS